MSGPRDPCGETSERGRAWALALACAALAQGGAGGAPTHEELISRAAGWTGLGRAAFVSVKPDMAVAIVRRDGPDRASGMVRNIELHGEVTNEAAAGEFGYRSMRSQVDVDCASRRDRVVRIDLYSEHNLGGRSQARRAPGGWAHPSPNAYLSDVIDAVCAPSPGLLRLAAADEPPAAAPVVRVAEATPTRPSAPQPSSRAPAAKPVSAPVLALVLGPSVAAGDSQIVAQIAASDSAAGASQALRGLKGRLGIGLSATVVPATVNGRQVYRAVIQGFSSRADARAFCSSQQKSGEDCWVR